MNLNARYRRTYSRCIGPALVLAAGLVLAGCGPSGGSAAGPAASHTSKAAGSSDAASPVQTSAGTTVSLANYPVAVGNTWVYQNSLGGTVTNKMIAVTPVSGGTQVTETNLIALAAGAPTTNQNIYVFHSDGSITYPSSQFGVSIQGGIVWPTPPQIASGQSFGSTLQISFTQNGQALSTTAHVTMQGAGQASVTVPAGTYQATIVDMTMAYTVESIPLSVEVQTWLANGVGPVQSQVTTTEQSVSRVADELKLQSFTKG
jgi:hypothetical protein